MTTPEGEHIDRLPAWITRVTQDISVSPVYDAVFWNPPTKYVFKNKSPPKPLSVRVYEAHGEFSSIAKLIASGYFYN
jgi:1,4-alpha-glucan branching enzyme